MNRNNNRRYNNNNINIINTFEDGTPKDWRNFIELKFKVTGIPTHVKEQDLRNLFSDHGAVHKIEIETTDDDESKGVAYVTFKPVPDYPFWAKQIRINRKLLRIAYHSHSTMTFVDQDGKTKLKFYTFPAASLEMGGYLDPNTFVPEFKYIEAVKFTINYQRRCIIIEFGVPFDQRCHFFKLEIAFNDVDGDFHVVLENTEKGPIGSITIANKFPAKYWVLDNRLQSKDNFNWCYDDSWKRKTELRVTPKSKEEKEIPLQPNMPDKSEKLGRCLAFRITLNLDMVGDKPFEGVKRFKRMIDLSKEYNLVSKNINIDETIPLCTIDGSILQKVVDRSKLNFRVLYMLESNISFNYLNNYNLKEDFIILLSKLPIHVAIYILEGIYSRKKRIYDPLTYLRSELQIIKSNHIDINPKYIPSHCVMMRKVVISPTTMYLLHPTIETSNRVIRRFRDKMDNFLRIQFVDEACGKVGSSNGNNIYALYNRIYHTLNRGIKIGNRHYEFLAFSSSQLRDHSCWFFASTEDLTANHIRDWMGDFTSIKNVAKYAARMGQCFSSTREIQDLPVNNIEEISDIVKNGYTFSDGVLDETQSLNENEIYCCVTDPNGRNGRRVITGTCIVFRNPCFHPGDIRVVTAVNCKNLSNLMDVVVFPATGYRDIPSQCSGGDLDGDDFTIIYDERLIPKKKRIEPMAYEAQRPDYIENVTIEDVQSFFVNYILSDQLGIIANSHLAKADHFETGAFHGQCIRLAQLHSEAVDFPKTGKPAILSSVLRANTFPDFMEKHDKPTYISEKVLGILYRSINEEAFNPCYQMVLDDRLHVQGYKTYVEEARKIKRTYDADIKGLMNQYGVKTEFEVTSGYIVNTIINLERKKSRDINKSVMDAFISIRRHYRKLFEEEFYGKGTNIISPVAHNRMRAKAAAWYFVTYHPAELKGNPSERMISFPWVAYDVLCDIVNETSESNVNNVINIKPNVKNKQKTAGKKSKSNTINVLPKNDDINDDIEVLKRSLN
ncbi:unnamed protein product [Rhizophagus irregularis]|nr:unnamed protein product [Rhizophagus irregularis]